MEKTTEKGDLVKFIPSQDEIVDLSADALMAAIESLPQAADPLKFLTVAGSVFVSRRIAKMCNEIRHYLKSKNAKTGENLEDPLAEFYATLKFLHEKGHADAEFLNALKNLHTLSFSNNLKIGEATELHILINTVREMNGPEILTIIATYRLAKRLYTPVQMKDYIGDYNIKQDNTGVWCAVVSRACGYSNSDYVVRQQKKLEELGLIWPNDNKASIGIEHGTGRYYHVENFRLTNSGVRLVEFINRGDEEIRSLESSSK